MINLWRRKPEIRIIERYAPGSGPVIAKRPEIFIMSPEEQKLWYYIEECPDEISGLGILKYNPDFNTLLIEKLHLFQQKVSGAETDLDQIAIGKFINEMVMQDQDTAAIKVWWHSHCSGGVYWSGHEDQPTITRLRDFGLEYLLSIVGNHRREYLCRLDVFQPVQITLDNLPLRVYQPEDGELRARLRAEIADKLTMSREFKL
jgi:hypothetical protein